MVPTTSLRLAALLLALLAVHVPAGAVDQPFSCAGLAPLFVGCEGQDVVWTQNVSADVTHFTGRVVVLATWLFKPGEIHYSGLVCEGPVNLDALPPEVRVLAPPAGCRTFAEPRSDPIAPGKLVHLECQAQSRELGPEQWVGPAGPWACSMT